VQSKSILIALVLIALAAPATADPAEFDLAFEPRDFSPLAGPPLPDPSIFPVQLVLDDDGAEGVFGLAGGTARQFLWLNSFANPGPFTLEQIWVLFPSGNDVPASGDVQLAVYLDPDSDPTTGAQLLATYAETIQAVDGDTFSVYQLPMPLVIDGPGDVLIGVVNRFFETGVDPPPTLPAALDVDASQNRSYFALWVGDADDPPDLAGATVIDALDGQISGNFMIRGFGTPIEPPIVEVPAVGELGLVLLAGLIAAVAVWRLRRRWLA